MTCKTCTRCKRELLVENFYKASRLKSGLAAWCKACTKENVTKWCAANPEKTRISKAAWIKAHPNYKKPPCARKRKQTVTRHKQYRRDLRKAVLNFYSDGELKCACCNESNYHFLTLDHINNNGAAHRKAIGRSGDMMLWIRRNKFPAGFQVLCYNCNCAKGIFGVCPHKGLVNGDI